MSLDSLKKNYSAARNRLLLLDYDGTLAEITRTPPEAAPTPRLLSVLEKLAENPRNTLVIVSGRRRQELDDWLGPLRLSLTAEHGAAWRRPNQNWQSINLDTSWKSQIKKVMQAAVTAVPGSFIEEKDTALTWQYRTAAKPEVVPPVLDKLLDELKPLAANAGLSLLPGKRIIELRPSGINKGLSAKRWLAEKSWDFVLAAGDDKTDEDLFAAMPHDTYTIKVGPGASKARIRLAHPKEMIELLEVLSDKS